MKTFRLLAAAPVAAFFLIISASSADSPAVAPAAPVTASASATDPAGNWKWSITPPNSDQSFESTAKLDFKDGKLTGTVTGRMGSAPISDGSVKDGTIAFTVVRERDDQKFVIKHAGKLAGDAIKGTIEFPGFGGGDPMKFDWNATRVK
jgi:uncharacterized protein with FMN-binding domain